MKSGDYVMSKNKEKNGKHLSLTDRLFIENALFEHMPLKEIARRLEKDTTTISKEIRQNRIECRSRVGKDYVLCSERTLYNYFEKQLFVAKNIDLPRKVRYRKRKRKVAASEKIPKCRDGRNYQDFLVSIQKARLEKNHEYIRYILPKGKSFDTLTQDAVISFSTIVSFPIQFSDLPFHVAVAPVLFFQIQSLLKYLEPFFRQGVYEENGGGH